MATQADVRSRSSSEIGLRCLSALIFLVIWQAGAALVRSEHFPGPLLVAEALYRDLTQGRLLLDLGITLGRVASSFVLALAVGSLAGILMGRSRRINGLFDLWLVIGLNIPAVVIIFLCYIWIGLTETAAIIAVALNKIPISAVILRDGARAVDHDLLQVAEVLHLRWGRRLRRVYLPQLYPYFMTATRTGLSLIWKIVLVVEFLGRSNGVGFKLNEYFTFSDTTNMLAYTASFLAVVLAIEGLAIRPLERRLAGWRQ